MRYLFALLLVLVVFPAVAQVAQKAPPAKIEREENVFSEEGALVQTFMGSEIPYLSGQKVYYKLDRKPIGFAIRHGRRIAFYDIEGKEVGHAIRTSQTTTEYWDDKGVYLGFRYRQQMTAKNGKEIDAKPMDTQRKEMMDEDLRRLGG